MHSSAFAADNEGAHWVCESEELYRSLLSVRLFGVGKEPESGCRTLPENVQVTEVRCINSDVKLCLYDWTENNQTVEMWGSAIISTLDNTSTR